MKENDHIQFVESVDWEGKGQEQATRPDNEGCWKWFAWFFGLLFLAMLFL